MKSNLESNIEQQIGKPHLEHKFGKQALSSGETRKFGKQAKLGTQMGETYLEANLESRFGKQGEPSGSGLGRPFPAEPPNTRLSYLAVSKLRVVVETRRNRPESIGIVMRRFVGTVPDMLGLVWPSFRPHPARNRRFPAGCLKVVWALLDQPRQGKRRGEPQGGGRVKPREVVSSARPSKDLVRTLAGKPSQGNINSTPNF